MGQPSNQDIMDKLNELHSDHRLHLAKFETLETLVDKLEHTVYGNGREGLVEATGRVEEQIKSLFFFSKGVVGVAAIIFTAMVGTFFVI